MGPPITIWPGQQGGGAPFVDQFARTPMFGAYGGPQYTGPFNFGGGGGALAMLAPLLQMLAPMLSGPGRFPAQFFPEQHILDQMAANQFRSQQQIAMTAASQRDAGTINQSLHGLRSMMLGRQLTQAERAQNFRMASGFAGAMPLLSQVLGPDLVDQLHGSQGSATVLAQQLHQAMRTSRDPVTGRIGFSGASAGRASQEIFERLFGEGAYRPAVRGLSAGQAGMMANELQSRGMLGRPLGSLSLQERRTLLPAELDTATVARIAETMPEVQAIRQAGGTPNEAVLRRAREQVRETHTNLRDPSVAMTDQSLGDFPGADEIIRAADADRIKMRVQNMSGAVRAMRDIFGDMGRPNAPMREIINGLDQLTQGGLATMSPSQLESMVRKTQALAQQTGIGVGGIMALSSQNALLADKLGLHRSYAVTAAQESAAFGAAVGTTGRLDIASWDARTQEQLTLSDTQLRMQAAASPFANQVNAMLRMRDEGLFQAAPGSELSAMLQAIEAGQTTYNFGGQEQSLASVQRSRLIDLLQEAGVNPAAAREIFSDYFGNQEYGQRYGTAAIARSAQRSDAILRKVAPNLGHTFGNINAANETDAWLRANGQDPRKFATLIGQQMSAGFFDLSSEVVADPERLQAELSRMLEERINAELGPLAGEFIAMSGGSQGLAGMASAMMARLDRTAAGNSAWVTRRGMHTLLGRETENEQKAQMREASASEIRMRSLSGVASAGPLRRMADALAQAGPDTSTNDLLQGMLGTVPVEDILDADTDGTFAAWLGLAQDNQRLDPRDDAQFRQIQQNAEIMQALEAGGDQARALREKLIQQNPGREDDKFASTLEQLRLAGEQGPGHGAFGAVQQVANIKVSKADVNATLRAGRRAEQALTGEATAESKKTIHDFLQGARQRAVDLMDDENSMLQLGEGGFALTHGLVRGTDELESLAAQASKALGREVSVEEVLRGGEGLDKYSGRANRIFRDQLTDLEEIDRRKQFGLRPGQGRDPANQKRGAMTDQERRDLEASRDFRQKYGTEDDRAEAAITRLEGLVPADVAEALRTDADRDRLRGALTEGNRSTSLNWAAHNYEELLQMGIRKGVFGDKKSIKELTDEERESVSQRLLDLDLTDREQADVLRLRKESEAVRSIGGQGQDVEAVLDDLIQNRIPQLRGGADNPITGAQDQKLTVEVKGVVDMRPDGRGDLALSGNGVMNSAANATGLV